ncbi:PAXNEB protein superfamily [Myriangium duriaei CBS 260.36]|uniref:Elongator complex protein 4 n=1 Tax=Myriangium duriaei CBS 260.36 TaxID=1168546 RepID=A0A9P4IUK3_9PEZI|nr:PAXNEB protein superfamily [Myriangium duriaei CBS 260.36]
MAFRKRNIAIQRAPVGPQDPPPGTLPTEVLVPGVRPSPLTGQPTTSTGIASLDSHLRGHAGLALGCSILVEEAGTTDFSGTLLKFFAAEGITQGHYVHIVGVGQQWTRELPGLIGVADAGQQGLAEPSSKTAGDEKMKIAWRYERLGQHDASRPGGVLPSRTPTADRADPGDQPIVFCHAFDLAKRLNIGGTSTVNHVPISAMTPPSQSPFVPVVHNILTHVKAAPRKSVHRIIIPSLLSPAYYPSHSASPENLIQFLHALRAIQRQFPDRIALMATVPTELYSRSSGVLRWAEHLCDGVIELQPFPHIMDAINSLAESGGARTGEEQPQGMLKFHKLPGLTERGAGSTVGASVGDDLAFTLSRRKFVIRPFSLPPMEQEDGQTPQSGADAESGGMKNIKKADIEF